MTVAQRIDDDSRSGDFERGSVRPRLVRTIFSAVVALTLALLRVIFVGAVALLPAGADPITSPWPVSGGGNFVAVASCLGGYFATAETFGDSVEIRDIDRNLIRTISKSDIEDLVDWFELGGGADGVTALAFSDSCRHLYILAYDDTAPTMGTGSDAVLRFDRWDDELILFAQLNLPGGGATWPFLSAAHHQGRLYVGSSNAGTGEVVVFQAGSNDTSGTALTPQPLPVTGVVRGLAVDRSSFPKKLYAATATKIYRADLGALPLSFVEVGEMAGFDIKGITYSTHFGAAGQDGLYLIDSADVRYVPAAQALGNETFDPLPYSTDGGWADIAATPDGKLLLGSPLLLSDDDDLRLGIDEFILDEFRQAVRFSKALVSPDGEPPGWVIDANVGLGGTRFHPATPDGAAWAILMLLMSDLIDGDSEAQTRVSNILVRYAGMSADLIVPERTVDGIYRHYYEPSTGNWTWVDEWAILSTMKLVLAAGRAKSFYSDDPVIADAANQIIFGVENWDSYVTSASSIVPCEVFLKAQAGGGPLLTVPVSKSTTFNEAILFVEQAHDYGDWTTGEECLDFWLQRSNAPTAEVVTSRPVSGDIAGVFLPAFPSLYSFLLQPAFRSSVEWRQHMENLRISAETWTDDNGPLFLTVFSAGTTPGGYNADSLTSHPDDIAHLAALPALASLGDRGPAVAAYHAYRNGARQVFEPGNGIGAELLYRRSNQDAAWLPNDAALPDVVYGALGLSAILDSTAVDAVLATLNPPPCDLVLDGLTVSDAKSFRACETIHVEDFSVTSTGDVILESGQSVTFGNDVTIMGTMMITINAELQDP